MPKIQQSDIGYYYAGSQRIAMRDANGVYFLLSDHLGSSSVVIDESGQIVESGYYLPWGGQRGDEGITATDYGYTGQMKEDDIYYYNARWPQVPEAQRVGFDPDISRFMQADSIVPLQVQGTQAFDRYAYVNNNPLRYTDPTGNYIIDGWDESYLQRQVGNTCGVVSLAMGLSVLYQKQVTQSDLQSLFPQTTPTILFPNGLGVPPGQLSVTTNIVLGQGVKATRHTGGTVEQLKQNIYDNNPTLVLIQLPKAADVGHYLLAIGYTEEEGFTFADPHGDIWRTEQDFVDRWGKERGFSSFNEVWSQDYWPVLQPNTLITLEYNTGATYGTLLQYVNHQNPIRLTGRWDHREEIR